jgi:DNA-binding NarL/FixJ family response regulator
MNFVKKILLIHSDEKTRRTLTLLLAGAGYDVRPCARSDAAIEYARSEWFDLSLVNDPPTDVSSFDFIKALRKIQPSVPVLLLVSELELPSIIKGIRMAVSDVLAPNGDWASVVKRINALLRPDVAPASTDLTAEELAEVETILAKFDARLEADAGSGAAHPVAPEAVREELQRLTRERDDFRKTAERLAQEKAALESELKAQLTRENDTAQLEKELSALRNEREMVAAAQAAVDEKARALAAAREEFVRERAAARPLEEGPGPSAGSGDPGREKEWLEDLRMDLSAEDVRQREEAARLRQMRTDIEGDRERLREDLEMLRDQETNLRAYEQRLRQMTADAETDRIRRVAPRPSRDPFVRDPSLEDAWSKVNRAMDLLEAERRSFTDEKLAFKDEKARITEWVANLREAEATLIEREQQLGAKTNRPSFTHQPFKAARAMLTGTKK